MNRSPLAAAWLALAVAVIPAPAQEKKAEDKKVEEYGVREKLADEKSLRAAREAYHAAFHRGDTATMAAFEDKDLTVFDDRKDALQDAADWRKGIDRLVKAKEWAPKRMLGETADVTVRVQKGKEQKWAVVVGGGMVENIDPKAKKEYKKFSETWDLKDGKWRLSKLHYWVGPLDDDGE